jgi:opacity protein-like surface antigen
MVSAALMPLAATSQVAPARRSHSVDSNTPSYKYSVYGGFAYSSLNQVNLSRSGLFGAEVYVTRNFGKYFGVVADGSYYRYPYTSPVVQNSTMKPSVDSVLFGPELHANLIGKYGGFVHGLIGGEHTAGTSQTPKISFAGGLGGGLEYAFTPRFSVRASGDYIGASFSDTGNSKALGYSPHRTWNNRASIGVMYRF